MRSLFRPLLSLPRRVLTSATSASRWLSSTIFSLPLLDTAAGAGLLSSPSGCSSTTSEEEEEEEEAEAEAAAAAAAPAKPAPLLSCGWASPDARDDTARTALPPKKKLSASMVMLLSRDLTWPTSRCSE